VPSGIRSRTGSATERPVEKLSALSNGLLGRRILVVGIIEIFVGIHRNLVRFVVGCLFPNCNMIFPFALLDDVRVTTVTCNVSSNRFLI
jgi:hypothetical protein